jgi:hypothetical protein
MGSGILGIDYLADIECNVAWHEKSTQTRQYE